MCPFKKGDCVIFTYVCSRRLFIDNTCIYQNTSQKHGNFFAACCGEFLLKSISAQVYYFYKERWSGWRDLNSRPSAPKADALPDCAMPRQPKKKR